MSVYEADLSSADVRILELPTGSGFADFSISAPRDGGYAITFAESPDGTETQSPGIPTLTAGGRIEGVQTCEVDDFDLLNKVTITLQGEVWRFDGTAEPALSRLDDLPLPGLVIADGDAGRRLDGDGLNDRIDGGGGGDDVLIGLAARMS